MQKKTAVMICGHGSRDVEAIGEFDLLAKHMRQRLPRTDVESGFLEFARPIIRDGLEKLKERGAERILAVPAMLFAAGHVKNDLPWEVNSFATENPAIDVKYGRELGIDLKLIRASAERIEEAERISARRVARQDSLLLVVGRGTNDPDANSNIAKVTRMLWEGMGFGWAETAFSGVTTPLVDAALDRAVKLGFQRIVVFPYFLFTGILVKRIYRWTEEAAAKYPQVEFLKASYLRDHPLVIDSFIERLQEMQGEGQAAMNCQLCKYREQALGYERDMGAVQTGHHHHVRGIGTDDDHGHHHGHGHDHGHHHGHDHPHHHGHDHHDHGHHHHDHHHHEHAHDGGDDHGH